MTRIKCSLLGILGLAALLQGAPQAVAQYFRDERLKILADDGAAEDWFGRSVAISGSIAIVGAGGADVNGRGSGLAYLFDVTTGAQVARLLPSDGAEDDYFGCSVAISGSTAIVGAPYDDDIRSRSGSAYLFDVATGTQIAKLRPRDAEREDYFGYSVAISGSAAVVGAYHDDDNGSNSGSAYLFNRASRAQIAKLLPSDGAVDDYFGYSVAISGPAVIVGAWGDDDDRGREAGSAYLFDANTGAQIAKLVPSDGAAGDSFGFCVAISESTAIVGAPDDSDRGPRAGSAYLFDVATGTQIAKLLARDGAADDSFGHSVAICGSTAIVGSYGDDDNHSSSGSASLFDVATGMQIAKLRASDGALNDLFGYSVAISESTAIAGAWYDDDNGFQSGSAYLFDTSGSTPMLTLEFAGACPGLAVFTVTNVTPGGKVALVYGFGDGPTTIPNPYSCTGVLLNVGAPNLDLRTVRANGNGVAALYTSIPAASCDQVRVQAIEPSTCAISEVVRP